MPKPTRIALQRKTWPAWRRMAAGWRILACCWFVYHCQPGLSNRNACHAGLCHSCMSSIWRCCAGWGTCRNPASCKGSSNASYTSQQEPPRTPVSLELRIRRNHGNRVHLLRREVEVLSYGVPIWCWVPWPRMQHGLKSIPPSHAPISRECLQAAFELLTVQGNPCFCKAEFNSGPKPYAGLGQHSTNLTFNSFCSPGDS